MAENNWWGDISVILLIVGGINWGLVGLADFNLVTQTVGQVSPMLETAVYGLVGISGLGAAYDRWVAGEE